MRTHEPSAAPIEFLASSAVCGGPSEYVVRHRRCGVSRRGTYGAVQERGRGVATGTEAANFDVEMDERR
jgi:hypothetical protein